MPTKHLIPLLSLLLYTITGQAQRDTIPNLGGESTATSRTITTIPNVINQQQWTRSLQQIGNVNIEAPLAFNSESQGDFISYANLPLHEIMEDYASMQQYFLFRQYMQARDAERANRLRQFVTNFDLIEALNYPIVRREIGGSAGAHNVRFMPLLVDSSRLDTSFFSPLRIASDKAMLWQLMYATRWRGDPSSFEPAFSFERYEYNGRIARGKLLAGVLGLLHTQINAYQSAAREAHTEQLAGIDDAFAHSRAEHDLEALVDDIKAYRELLDYYPDAAQVKTRVLQAIDSLPQAWQSKSAIATARQSIDDFPIATGSIWVDDEGEMFMISAQDLQLAADYLTTASLSTMDRETLANYAQQLDAIMKPMRTAAMQLSQSYTRLQAQLTMREDSLYQWVYAKFQYSIKASKELDRQLRSFAEAPADSSNYLQLLLLAENMQIFDAIISDTTGKAAAEKRRDQIKQSYLFALRQQEGRFLQLQQSTH